MGFDVAAAKKAGYTDADIADYLAKEAGIDAAAARDSGWEDHAIITELAKAPPKPKSTDPINNPQFSAPGSVDPTRRPILRLRKPPLLIDESVDSLVERMRTRSAERAAKEQSEARRQANRPRGTRTTPSQTKTEVDESAGGAFGRGLTRAALPTAAGIGGAELGAMAAAPTAPFTLGLGPPVVGALTGMGSAYLANKAQESVIDKLPEDYRAKLGFGHEQQLTDAQLHPYATFAGGVAPGYLFARPTGAITPTVAGGALGALVEGGREFMYGDGMDPGLLTEAALAGATQTKGYGAARAIAGPKDTAIERTLRRYRPEPGEGRRIASEVHAIGEQPRPVDVLPDSMTAHLGAEATTGSLDARDLLRKYAGDTRKAVPTVARRNVDKIAPDDARTGAEAAEQASQEALEAQERVRPGVTAGDASTAVSEHLLSEEAREKAGGDVLFARAREKGVAQLQRREPPKDETDKWSQLTPEQETEFDKSGWLNRETGEILTNAEYNDLQRSKGPGPEVAANLREAISGYALRPNDIEGTSKLLAQADDWSTVDTSNLYGLRDQLGELERRYPGTPDAGAAAAARHRLDDFIAQADAEGRFTGDPEVVSANRAAIDYWRNFRQRYGGNTLIGRVTQQEWRGDRRQPVMDPQTAGQAILGTLKESGDRLRDLQELRDRLGPDSDLWQALRREAMDRVAKGSKETNPRYVENIAAWREANPKLAELIMGAEGNRALSESRAALTDTSGRQEAMGAGADFLQREPQDFSVDVAGMSTRARRDATVTLRQTIRDALTTPGSSMAMLENIATNPKAQANMRALLSPQEAIQAAADAQAILRRVEASRAPLGGSKAPEDAETLATDVVRVAGAAPGHPVYRALSNAFMDLMQGKGMPATRRKEAYQLAKDLLDPAKTQATLQFVEQMAGQNGVQRMLGVARQGAASRLDALVRLGRIPAAWMAGQMASEKEPGKVPQGGAGEPEDVLKSMSDEELDAIIGGAGEAGSNGPDMSRGERNNNPGNLRDYPWVKKQPGYVGDDGDGYAKFKTPEEGVAAQEKLLRERYLSRGVDTPNKIVETYAPAGENTPEQRKAYKAYIAKRLGIGINDKVPMNRLNDLAQANREFETGAVVEVGR